MEDIIKIIYSNNQIENSLKDKIIECVRLIVLKYPQSYRNLYKNLENIKIEYPNSSNINLLNSIGVTSFYDSINNVAVLDRRMSNGSHYKNLLIHELLHVASYNKNELGFKNISSYNSVSLNEGYTEYLTRNILNSFEYGMSTYNNDVNNTMIFKCIIGENNLTNVYFNGGLLKLLELYINSVGSSNNIKEIIINMDKEHNERVKNFNFDNEYKDKYIPLLISDFSKINTNSNNEINSKISLITSFIRSQYQTTKVPNSIKNSIEDSINNILKGYSFDRGKTL